MEEKDLRELIECALSELYVRDKELIDIKANERAIVFRFGIYFQEILNANDLGGYNLDCE